MKKCFKCGTENKDASKFCRVCGNSFISAGIFSGTSVIDGKKTKRHYNLTSKISQSFTLTSAMLVFLVVLASGCAAGGYILVRNFILKESSAMSSAFSQLMLKMQYVFEGTSIKYASKQLKAFIGYLSKYFALFALILIFIAALISIIYYCIIFNYRLKYKNEVARNPVVLTRIYSKLIPVMAIIAGAFAILYLLSFLTQL